jgi:hypothetical protein
VPSASPAASAKLAVPALLKGGMNLATPPAASVMTSLPAAAPGMVGALSVMGSPLSSTKRDPNARSVSTSFLPRAKLLCAPGAECGTSGRLTARRRAVAGGE